MSVGNCTPCNNMHPQLTTTYAKLTTMISNHMQEKIYSNETYHVPTDDVITGSFESGDYSVGEGSSHAQVCVVISATPVPGQPVSVLVSTTPGTAKGKIVVPVNKFRMQ